MTRWREYRIRPVLRARLLVFAMTWMAIVGLGALYFVGYAYHEGVPGVTVDLG